MTPDCLRGAGNRTGEKEWGAEVHPTSGARRLRPLLKPRNRDALCVFPLARDKNSD